MKNSAHFNKAFALFAVLIALVAFSVSAQELKWRFPTDKITTTEWNTYLREVKENPHAKVSENWGFIIVDLFSDPNHPAFYTFTKPNHPAYPSVVVRMVVPTDHGSTIVTHGHFAGSQTEFDKMWKQFQQLNESYSK